ncbi:hypothetical protein [Rhodococcus wratislaviensis]|uniref:Uncharacterized protein n=1 Tax=Rhodococcus wratislaviensis NBRC 100605 TaxID=1219028 RepID=X0R3V0_RHOWR|nr:hypothetical protein [Rhodococcus wratislaviensis]GAF45560.1 hypothetical protein RW1_022_01400 [Rhodococcus wratislaviensis NBRC 100605]
MTKNYGRRNAKRGPRPKTAAPAPLPGSAAPPSPELPTHLLPPGLVIVCGNVGLTPLTATERADALAALDAHQALAAVAGLYSELDIARSSHGRVQRIALRVLADIEAAWAAQTAARVRRGDHFLTPRGLGQLLREILEHGTADPTRPALDQELMGRLLLSISTEQHSRPEFAGDVPTAQEMKEFELRTLRMDLDETRTALRKLIPDEIASFLYETTLKLEILQANTYDTWFAPWPIKITDPLLGNTPAEAFAAATGVDLVDVLRLGSIIEAGVTKGRVEFTRDALLGAGADPAAVDLLARSMSLSPAEYQTRMRADRSRGAIAHQRYTMTQFPFVTTGNDTFLLLRYQWGIDRFFGSNLHWETYGSFEESGHRPTAKAFGQGMDFMFEHQIGLALNRITQRSHRISALVTEKEMQEQWTASAGRTPSACDWALIGDKVSMVIDATNHPMNAALAQGMATVDDYESDVDRTFTDRKFRQLAATMTVLRDRGWDGTAVGPDTDFIPLVIVPDTGLPNTTLTDYDLQQRSHPIFTEFEPHVFAPAVLTRADLQLLEGIGDHYYPRDIVELLGGWRHACMRTPIPIRLDDFLEQLGIQRPISKHIERSHHALVTLLSTPTQAEAV